MLNHERAFVEYAAMGERMLEDLTALWRERGMDKSDDPVVRVLRHKLAEFAVEIRVCRMLQYRFVWLYGAGKNPSFEASELKILGSEMTQRFAHTAVQVLGLFGQVDRETSNKAHVLLDGYGGPRTALLDRLFDHRRHEPDPAQRHRHARPRPAALAAARECAPLRGAGLRSRTPGQ